MAREPLIGERVGGFEILETLGRGGFATVYRARQIRLDREVALKILDPLIARDPDAARRFEREGWAAAGLDHPSIVPVYEADEDDGLLYLAMRLVEGRPLSAEIPEQLWTGDKARTMASTIGDALDHAHERGVLHRDVKPANILVEGDRLWLTDFGIAVLARATARYTAGTIGTAHYMAPEQVKGEEVGPTADLYSLGCVLFECLTGEPPYGTGDMAAVMYAHVHEPVPSTGEPSLDAFFARALGKDPAERFTSGREMAAALDELAGAPPVQTPPRPPAPVPLEERRGRRRRVPFIGIAVAVIAAIVVAMLLLRSDSKGVATEALASGLRGPVNVVDSKGARYALPSGWRVAAVTSLGDDRNTDIRAPNATVLIGSRSGHDETSAQLADSDAAGDFRCPPEKQTAVTLGGVATVRCTFVPANRAASADKALDLYYAATHGQAWILNVQPTGPDGSSRGADVDRFMASVRLGPSGG